ncbi:MAG TPA: Smr/MutS family protein [Acidobacteriota bacterium]
MTQDRPESIKPWCADLAALEFAQALDMVASFAGSVYGAEAVRQLRPERPAPASDRDLELIEELAEAQRSVADLTIQVPGDVRPLLRRLAPSGSILDGNELLELAAHFEAAGAAFTLLRRQRRWVPKSAASFAAAPESAPLAAQIRRCIGPDGEVLDSASPLLRKLRAERRRLEKRVRGLLADLVRDPHYQNALQDTLVTDRNGRWVVPVKAGQRAALQGVVQASSGSGSTLFFEPQGVVGLNNDLALLRVKENEEQLKVLRALSEQLRSARGEMERGLELLADLDGLLARAHFQLACDGCRPRFDPDGAIELLAARHPLLDQRLATCRERVGLEPHHGRAAVPLDFELGPSDRALVITGPNTGGKTVVLKTVGLLAALAHAGVPLPAQRARLVRLSALWVDIGDRQDLAMNLSTFSAHMSRLLPAFAEARRPALVLIDELGTGTDPAEGSALGVAILEELLRRGLHLLVTTHHHAIKRLALRTPGMVNAAMEFDPATLAPTFRLLPGRAGGSHAFEVAEALGLPPEVLEGARRHAAGRERELDQMFERLDVDAAALRERERRIAGREAELAAAERQAEIEIQRRAQATAGAAAAARAEIAELRRRAQHLFKEAERAPDRAARRELRRSFETLSQQVAALAPPAAAAEAAGDGDLAAGDSALLAGLGLRGRVLEAGDPDQPDSEVLLEVEGKRLRLPRAQVRRLEPEPRPAAARTGQGLKLERRALPAELDLRGLTVEAALERADKYLDDALLAERHEVRVIHGYGTERLKKALREYLARQPQVESIRAGGAGEGGDGVTVVGLKHDA